MPGGPLRFVKAHAYGNDFLLLDIGECRDRAQVLSDLARLACARHTGLGADGLIVVTPTADGADTRLYNADGSQPEVSGNGVRCVAASIAHQRGLTPGATLAIGTAAGPKRLTLLDVSGRELTFRADMGQPEDLREATVDLDGRSMTVVTLRVGNPQCVVFGPLTPERLHAVAGRLAVHPAFPDGTNVELATVEAPDRVQILIWERGVGPTEASGTGACAAAVAAAAFGGARRTVDVISPGGVQRVEWTDRIWLTGAATLVAEMTWWPPGRG
jgi:diaminopimelate epimerase